MWNANYILVAVRWHTVVTCTRHASSNPALSAGTERKKLWYTHTHTHRCLSHRQKLCSDLTGLLIGWEPWTRLTLQSQPVPLTCAWLVATITHDTVTQIWLWCCSAEKVASVCESMKQKRVTVSHFPCNGRVRFYWKRWSLWNVLILQGIWIESSLLYFIYF